MAAPSWEAAPHHVGRDLDPSQVFVPCLGHATNLQVLIETSLYASGVGNGCSLWAGGISNPLLARHSHPDRSTLTHLKDGGNPGNASKTRMLFKARFFKDSSRSGSPCGSSSVIH